MSCSANKTVAIADFTSNSFASGVSPIEVFEETQSTNNECDCGVTKGTLNATLTFGSIYPTKVKGTGKIYLKIDPQADGYSDTGINTAPVTTETPSGYNEDSSQTVTLNAAFVSTTYANVTPAFSPVGSVCAADKVLGWSINDAKVIMTRTILQEAYAKFT